MPKTPSSATIIRVSKFGAVGIVNTLVDFLIFNLLTALGGWPILLANVASTTIAMIVSFFANRHLVFRAGGGSAARQAASFFIVTAFGLYVLQLGALHFLTSVWRGPVNVAIALSHGLRLHHALSDTFVANNSAKVVATLISLTWNYIVYKRVVFRNHG